MHFCSTWTFLVPRSTPAAATSSPTSTISASSALRIALRSTRPPSSPSSPGGGRRSCSSIAETSCRDERISCDCTFQFMMSMSWLDACLFIWQFEVHKTKQCNSNQNALSATSTDESAAAASLLRTVTFRQPTGIGAVARR